MASVQRFFGLWHSMATWFEPIRRASYIQNVVIEAQKYCQQHVWRSEDLRQVAQLMPASEQTEMLDLMESDPDDSVAHMFALAGYSSKLPRKSSRKSRQRPKRLS